MRRPLLILALLPSLALAQPLLPSELPAEAVRGLSAAQLDTVVEGLRLAGAPGCATAADCLKGSLQNLRIAVQLAREARTAEQIAAAIGLPPEEGQPQAQRRFDVPVPKEAPSRGAAKAPVTLVTWLDFQCPFSQRLQETLRKLGEKYQGKVRFVVRHLPLPYHRDAAALAAMSLHAHDKGRFWEFHDRLFALRSPSRGAIKALAAELKLDAGALEAAPADRRYAALLERDAADAKALDTTGTPATFVNGRLLSGAQPLEAFELVIDEELANASPAKLGK